MSKAPSSTGKIKNCKVQLLAVVTLTCCLLVLGACGPNPTDTSQATATPSANLKVSSVLVNIFVTYQTASGSPEDRKKAAIQYARDTRVLNSKDEIAFELELDSAGREQAVTEKIKSMGGKVRNATNLEGTVKLQVNVPVDVFINYANSQNKDNFLNDLASFQGVKTINLLLGTDPLELAGLPDSVETLSQVAQTSQNEGVRVMGTTKWQAAGFRGQGARIGVVDVGFRYYEKFLGTTLPAELETFDAEKELGGPGAINADVHGTAVLEIIHSIAPEAQIFAAALGNGTDSEFKAAIEWLISKNVSIISGSVGHHRTQADGNSLLEKYIERVRKEKGIVFLFSSGNEGDSHYTSFFNPDEEGFHQFLPGVTRMAVAGGSRAPLRTYFSLIWEQYGFDKKQVNDLDLFLLDSSGNPVRGGSSQDFQSARDPIELLPITLEAKQTYYLRIRQKPGTPAYVKPFRLHLFGRNLTFQFIVPQMAVAVPSSSKGALAIGATDWQSDKWAYYSSQGPLPDGRFKPDVSAPANVSSRAYEEEGQDSFAGTSASCPQVAGVAGLLKGANSRLTADQLEALLRESVKDLSPVGPDFANGYGRVDLNNLQPSANVAPQGKASLIAPVDVSNLQFPVLVFRRYPAPQVATPSNAKANPPTPLPSRATNLEDGASNDSRVLAPGATPPITTAPAPTPTILARTTAARTTIVGTSSTPIPPTSEPFANTVFTDDFKNPLSGLPNSGNSSYQDGSYRLQAKSGQLAWSAYPNAIISASDFGAEVTVQGASKDGLYGLLFWQQDARNYYLLSVAGQGQYQVSQFSNGVYKEIIGWNVASGWKTGTANILRLTINRGTIRVSINNQAGKAGQVTTGGQGGLGFAVGSYGNADETVIFTDFRLNTGK